MAHIDVAIAERARNQLGLITSAQLTAAGLSRMMRRTRVSDGRLIRLSQNVYRIPALPVTWHQQVLAAVLEGGPEAAAAFMAAAALDGLDGIGPGAVEILVPRNRRPVGVNGRVHWASNLPPGDVNRTALIPRTSPERTLLDIAPRLTRFYLEQAVDSAARGALIVPSRLIARIEAESGGGRRRLDDLLDLLRGAGDMVDTESWLESRTLRIYLAAGLPVPRVQAYFDPKDGRLIRVDFFFEAERLVVEVLGHRTHSTRRQLSDDAERRAQLTLLGYEVLEFTYEHVRYRPDYVAATTATHLVARSCAGSGSSATTSRTDLSPHR